MEENSEHNFPFTQNIKLRNKLVYKINNKIRRNPHLEKGTLKTKIKPRNHKEKEFRSFTILVFGWTDFL